MKPVLFLSLSEREDLKGERIYEGHPESQILNYPAPNLFPLSLTQLQNWGSPDGDVVSLPPRSLLLADMISRFSLFQSKRLGLNI